MIARMLYKPDWLLHIGHLATLYYNQIYCSQNEGIGLILIDDLQRDPAIVDQWISDIQWINFRSLRPIKISHYLNIIFKFARFLIQNHYAYIDTPDIIDKYSLIKYDEMVNGNSKYRIKLKMDPPEMDIVIMRYSPNGLVPHVDFMVAFIDLTEKVDRLITTSKIDIVSPEIYNKLNIICKFGQSIRTIYREPYKITDFKYTKKIIDGLICDGKLDGYDDPRLLTIAGIRRRGFTPDVVESFCGQGALERKINIDYMELVSKSVYDINCERCFGVIDPVKIVIINWPERSTEFITKPLIPDNHDSGIAMVPLSNIIYIDRHDFTAEPDDNFHGLSLNHEVRLKYSYIIHCHDYSTDDTGQIKEIYATYSQHERKIKGCIHWISSVIDQEPIKADFYLYNTLYLGKIFHNSILDIPVQKYTGYIEKLDEFNNKNGENKVYQLERVGYFIRDPTKERLSFNLVTGLKRQKIPYLSNSGQA